MEQTAFPHLQKQQYMSLTTFRKNGEPVATPVWFAQVDDKLYVFSAASAGKVKRIRHTTRVTVAPCTIGGTVTGTAQEASARIMDSDEGQFALASLNRKYGLLKRIYDMMMDFLRWVQRRPASDLLYLEISSA